MFRPLHSLIAVLFASLSCGVAHAEAPKLSAEDTEFFETKIRPVLVDRCYECHSAKSKKVKGGLLLDTREGLLKGGDTGPGLVAGKPDDSLLIQAVRRLDKDLAMPPKDALPAAQVEDFIKWVKLGAPDPRVEASTAVVSEKKAIDYVAERKKWAFHKPEQPVLPAVKDTAWVKTPVDTFVLAKLEAAGLQPAPAADKTTLIRRVTLDLTGLPPSPQEVEAFVKDESPDAYRGLVERLLAAPGYAEQWGRHWLDVVRYADSWDSRSTGTDFDFLDAWRYRDWVVKAFHRDLPYDQFITEQLAGDLLAAKEWDADKLAATGVFALGSWGNGDADKKKIHTDIVDDQIDVVGRGFLGMTFACARCHDHKFDPITTADYYALSGFFFSSRILEKFQAPGSGERLMRIPMVSPAERAEFAKQKARLAEAETGLSTVLRALTEVEANAYGVQGLIRWNPKGIDNPSIVINPTDAELAFSTVRLAAHSISLHPGKSTSVTAAWQSSITGKVRVSAKLKDIDPLGGEGIVWSLRHAAKRLKEGTFPNNGSVEIAEEEVTVKPGELVQLVINGGKDYFNDSTEVEFVIRGEDGHVWDLREAMMKDSSQGKDGWWIGEGEGTWVARGGAEASRLETERKELTARIAAMPMCQGFQDGGIPGTDWEGVKESKVHIRGRYDRLGDPTPRAFPALLTDQKPELGEGSGRLALAKWVTSPDNPLTARVMANRVWQHHFGEGIVRTANNYGKLGTPPSHPELLDWLALKFMAGTSESDAELAGLKLPASPQWSIKALHRLMLLSSTYRQSSSPTAATLKADAGNQLFSRQSRRRLSAEEFRDALLVSANRLDRTQGGPSIADLNAPRRTMYISTVRSNRATYQLLFDGADPGGIVEKRTDSVVAPQALWLLNHPFALAQTEALFKRMEAEAGADKSARIAWLYRQLFLRAPVAAEVSLCEDMVKTDDAKHWTELCQMLLCSNEFAYID